MELIKQLSKQQLVEYQKMLSLLTSDEKTQQLCLSYFFSFKAQIGYISLDKLPIALKCAYFIAEKSQYVYNLKGQRVKNIGLSLSQLLKNHKLDDIMMTLKQFCKKIKIPDEDAERDLNGIVKEISFLITFHSKFQRVIQKLQFKERVSEAGDYQKIFTSFVWLLYVETKTKVLSRSLQLIENTCLLAQTIAFMVIYSWEYIRPTYFMKGDKKLSDQSTWKQISLFVKQKVLEIFLIKNMDVYVYIAKSFQSYFQQMIDSGVIKVSSNKVDFSSPDLINSNYKRLDHSYQKSLTPHDLDQRIFFKDRATNLTPSKFTPFSRQGYANKVTKHIKNGSKFDNKQNLTSHRILTYDLIERGDVELPRHPTQMKIPKSVMQSPSTIKIPLICSTPISTGMEMFNYLSQKAKKSCVKTMDASIETILNKIFELDRKDIDKNTKNMKKCLIYSIYTLISDQYFSQYPEEYNESKMKTALLALSVELVFFVSNITLTFDQIEYLLQVEILQEWKACDFFLKFDKSMPSTLKLHLLDIEVNIVSYKVWKNKQIMNSLSVCANGQQLKSHPIQRLFKRLMHQIAYQVTQICQKLKIDEKVTQIVFETMKQILLFHIDILSNRNIDQLIICSIYANAKVGHLDVKFNQIKQVYSECNPHNKNTHQQLMCHVFVSNHSPIDIISFYNTFFIPTLKMFITSFKDKNYKPTHSRNNYIMKSNLKTIIPKQISFRQSSKLTGGISNFNKANNTPQSSLLYAYNQSPILKYQMHSFKGPLISKKVINFDEQEQKLWKNCDNISEGEDSFLQTTDFISKKFNKKNGEQGMSVHVSPTNTNKQINFLNMNTNIFNNNTYLNNKYYIGTVDRK